MNARRIWLVLNTERINTHPPRCLHGAYDTALGEAERLARENPGQVFHVMASVSASVKHDVTTIQFNDDPTEYSDDMPF